jgi:hypothetical protein
MSFVSELFQDKIRGPQTLVVMLEEEEEEFI